MDKEERDGGGKTTATGVEAGGPKNAIVLYNIHEL